MKILYAYPDFKAGTGHIDATAKIRDPFWDRTIELPLILKEFENAPVETDSEGNTVIHCTFEQASEIASILEILEDISNTESTCIDDMRTLQLEGALKQRKAVMDFISDKFEVISLLLRCETRSFVLFVIQSYQLKAQEVFRYVQTKKEKRQHKLENDIKHFRMLS